MRTERPNDALFRGVMNSGGNGDLGPGRSAQLHVVPASAKHALQTLAVDPCFRRD